MVRKIVLLVVLTFIFFTAFPSAAFAACCIGNPGCGNYTTEQDCTDYSCTWTCTPTPTPPPTCCIGGPYCKYHLEWESCHNDGCVWDPVSCPITSGCIPKSAANCTNPYPSSCSTADGSQYCCVTAGECSISRPPAATSQVAEVFCDSSKSSIRTAFGCAPINGIALLNVLLPWGVGISAGIALLLLGYAGFQIATSTGDPKKMKAGQELLISALTGLVLIALAIVLINFLGKTVLNLPNFSV